MQKDKIKRTQNLALISAQEAIFDTVDERGQERIDEQLLATYGKTFYFAARFLPAQRRQALTTLYGFFRLLDDLVDERTVGWDAQDVRLELDAWRGWLNDGCRASAPRAALGTRLAELIEQHHIPQTLFLDFLDGLLSDLYPREIRTFRELYRYCYCVAGTVGRVLAHLMGTESPQALLAAEHLGIGMQLTNILRDVGADLASDRVYLPQDDLLRFGSSRAHLTNLMEAPGCLDDRFRVLMRYQIRRAHSYYACGLPGIWMLPADCRLPMLLAGRLYRRILTVIERRDYNILQSRASTNMAEKIQEAVITSLVLSFWKEGITNPAAEWEVALEAHAEG